MVVGLPISGLNQTTFDAHEQDPYSGWGLLGNIIIGYSVLNMYI